MQTIAIKQLSNQAIKQVRMITNNNKTFKDLLIWQKSQYLIDKVISELKKWDYRNILILELFRQLYRSVQSVGANIAEGYGRGSNKDFKRFLIIARGSLSETEHWLLQVYKEKLINEEKLKELEQIILEIKKMLASFIYKLDRQKKA